MYIYIYKLIYIINKHNYIQYIYTVYKTYVERDYCIPSTYVANKYTTKEQRMTCSVTCLELPMQTWHVYLHKKRHSKHPVYAHRRLPLPWLLEHFSGPIIQVGSVQQGLWILPLCLLAISLGKYLLRSRYDIRIFHPQCYSYLRLYLEFKETQKKTCHSFFFVFQLLQTWRSFWI